MSNSDSEYDPTCLAADLTASACSLAAIVVTKQPASKRW